MSYVSPTIEAAGQQSPGDGAQPTPTALVPFVAVATVVAVAVGAVVGVGLAVEVMSAVGVLVETVTVVGSGCFTAGTKIIMSDGSYKNIEEIRTGDIVKAFDIRKKKYTNAKVVNTFYHNSYEIPYYLIINSNLEVTPNHPMYINNKWIRADELKIGDSLLNKEGKLVKVRSIDTIYKNAPVYNLEVDKYHTYFANGILVHNKNSVAQNSKSQSVTR